MPRKKLTVEARERNLLARANEVVRRLAVVMGYDYPEGFRFDRSTCSRAQRFWALGVVAYEELAATDITDTATIVNEEEDWAPAPTRLPPPRPVRRAGPPVTGRRHTLCK